MKRVSILLSFVLFCLPALAEDDFPEANPPELTLTASFHHDGDHTDDDQTPNLKYKRPLNPKNTC